MKLYLGQPCLQSRLSIILNWKCMYQISLTIFLYFDSTQKCMEMAKLLNAMYISRLNDLLKDAVFSLHKCDLLVLFIKIWPHAHPLVHTLPSIWYDSFVDLTEGSHPKKKTVYFWTFSKSGLDCHIDILC